MLIDQTSLVFIYLLIGFSEVFTVWWRLSIASFDLVGEAQACF